jgi:hypothetical protein
MTVMSRVHDMGGQTGFGAVPVGDIGPGAAPGFHANWEARVYLVLPARPAGTGSMTADELAGLVTLNGLIGTALV